MSLLELSEAERELVRQASEAASPQFKNVQQATGLFYALVSDLSTPRPTFVGFYGQAKKHLALSLLSIMRRHRTLGKLSLRYFLESTVQAGYAYAHPALSEYFDSVSGIVGQEKAAKRANSWLTSAYPPVSLNVKWIKGKINEQSSHANFLSSFVAFEPTGRADELVTPFFDDENVVVTNADLLLCARSALIAVDLLLALRRDHGGCTLTELARENWSSLLHNTDDLFAAELQHPVWVARAKRAVEDRKPSGP